MAQLCTCDCTCCHFPLFPLAVNCISVTSTIPHSSSLPSTMTTAVSSSPLTMEDIVPGCKGKISHRSWSQLPPEIIRFVDVARHTLLCSLYNLVRLVTTHYILDVCSTISVPHSWDTRDMWHPRLVFTVLRDAIEIEKLMCICPAWSVARK